MALPDLPAPEPRDLTISLKLSRPEYIRLRELAAEQGVSMSHVLRTPLRPTKAAP